MSVRETGDIAKEYLRMRPEAGQSVRLTSTVIVWNQLDLLLISLQSAD